jgi:protein O-mannosyl-transferase
VEVAMQKEGESWEVPRTDSALSRLAGAGWCVWFYLYKLIWPLNLSFIYPRWTIDGGKLWSFVPDVLLFGAVLLAWLQQRRFGRAPFMVLLCYVALLLPVLGFTNIYFMRYSLVADHWQYAAMIVPTAGLAACLVAAAQARMRPVRVAATMTTVALLVGLGTLTYSQAGIYKDEETLWQDVLKRNPDFWLPHHSLGNWLANRGRSREAAVHYEEAVRLRSDDFQAHNNLGVMLGQLGRPEQAIASYERALAIDATYARARQNVIAAYKRFGKQLLDAERDYETARMYFTRVVQLAPNDAEAHYGLAVVLIETGDVAKAVDELREAVRLRANFLPAYDLLAQHLATRAPSDGGDPDRALQAAQRACALTAYGDPARLDTLAIAYASAGRFDEAVATEERALEIVQVFDPQNLAEVLRARRNLFRAGKPFRAPARN